MHKIKPMTIADIFTDRGAKGRTVGKMNMPIHGKSNTEYHPDYGTSNNQVQTNADNNRSFMGVHTRPKEFQPFFRFDGATTGAIDKSSSEGTLGGRGVGQPDSLAYGMKSQGIRLVK